MANLKINKQYRSGLNVNREELKKRRAIFEMNNPYKSEDKFIYIQNLGILYKNGYPIDRYTQGEHLPYYWATCGKVKIFKHGLEDKI